MSTATRHMDNAIARIQQADPAFWQQEGDRLASALTAAAGSGPAGTGVVGAGGNASSGRDGGKGGSGGSGYDAANDANGGRGGNAGSGGVGGVSVTRVHPVLDVATAYLLDAIPMSALGAIAYAATTTIALPLAQLLSDSTSE